MDSEVKRIVSVFVSKAKGTYSEGQIISLDDFSELNRKLTYPLPDWFIDLYSTFPLAGSQLDFPENESENDLDEYYTIELATPQNIYDEMELCYPGIAINGLGYFCIGIDLTGSGDQFFCTSKNGANPPVVQVYHDVSDEGEEIERNGMNQIADSLSDFFSKARVIKKYS